MATSDLDSTTVRGPSGPVHSHIARPAGLSPFPADLALLRSLAFLREHFGRTDGLPIAQTASARV